MLCILKTDATSVHPERHDSTGHAETDLARQEAAYKFEKVLYVPIREYLLKVCNLHISGDTFLIATKWMVDHEK